MAAKHFIYFLKNLAMPFDFSHFSDSALFVAMAYGSAAADKRMFFKREGESRV